MKVSVYPIKDYIIEIINTRGITLASHEEKLDILFYTGTDLKELKELLNNSKAECVVLNNLKPKINSGFFWIYHDFNDWYSFLNPDIIYTNTEVLAKELYRILGIQTKIKNLSFNKKKRMPNNFFEKVKEIMMWE